MWLPRANDETGNSLILRKARSDVHSQQAVGSGNLQNSELRPVVKQPASLAAHQFCRHPDSLVKHGCDLVICPYVQRGRIKGIQQPFALACFLKQACVLYGDRDMRREHLAQLHLFGGESPGLLDCVKTERTKHSVLVDDRHNHN